MTVYIQCLDTSKGWATGIRREHQPQSLLLSPGMNSFNSSKATTKTKPLPTPGEMKAFAGNFSKEQWHKLCSNQRFLDTFTLDLDYAAGLAERILTNKLADQDR